MKFFHEEVKPKFDHYGYTLKHKWNIVGPGRELGVGWSTLLKHDLDKLWDPRIVDSYSDFFYSPRGIRGSNDPEVRRRFRESMQRHKERSPHHYHQLGQTQSEEHRLESIADVYSLLKTTGQTDLDFGPWYEQKGKYINGR